MYYGYDINEKIIALADETEKEIAPIFADLDELCLKNSAKVLKAFHDEKVSYTDFAEVNGYGFYDAGRDKIEAIFAKVFKAEDSLVRPQIMSGTHALALTFSGLLKYGETMLSISGTPYDSLQTIIGIAGESRNSLIANGVKLIW